MDRQRYVLWVDDDGRDRFLYELSILEENGLVTDWAFDAEEAISLLSKKNYDLVLLDQVFPVGRKSSYKDVWSGCRLLYWLRGEELPAEAPQGALWAGVLDMLQPLEENSYVPVIIISGFQDDFVDKALHEKSQGITIFPKPVNGDKLLAKIDQLMPREPS